MRDLAVHPKRVILSLVIEYKLRRILDILHLSPLPMGLESGARCAARTDRFSAAIVGHGGEPLPTLLRGADGRAWETLGAAELVTGGTPERGAA